MVGKKQEIQPHFIRRFRNLGDAPSSVGIDGMKVDGAYYFVKFVQM
jgi:hypothetical protein